MWIVRFYLFILDLLMPLYVALGINYDQLRQIVGVKLMMDNRRTRLTASGQAQIKESNFTFVWTLAINFLLGCILLFFLFYPIPLVAFSLVYAGVMFMLGMTLITDFSSVILDASDNLIILTRPVDSRTFLAARNTHILIYLSSITFVLLLPSAIGTTSVYGPLAGLVFVLLGLLSTVLVVFLTNLLYLTLMRFTSEERLRNVINAVQIMFVFLMMGGYRLVGRFVNAELLQKSLATQHEWWHYCLPPIWLGQVMDALTRQTFSTEKGIYLGLSLVSPMLVLFALSRSAKLFNNRITGMEIARRDSTQTTTRAGSHRTDWVGNIASWACRHPVERGAFELIWHFTSRDRKFKLRVYPSLFYFLFYFPLFLMGSRGQSFAAEIEELSQSNSSMIMVLYFSFSSLSTLTQGIQLTEDIKPAWVYTIAPITQPGRIMAGAFLAISCRFLIPIILLVLVLGLSIWGVQMLDDLVFALLVVVNIELLLALAQTNHLPLTIEIKENQGGHFLRALLWMFGLGLISLAHWGMLWLSPWVVTGLIPLLAGMLVIVFRKYRTIIWSKVYEI